MRRSLAALALLAVVVAIGCGDDDESSEPEASGPPTLEEVQACLANANLEVALEPGQYLINGGEAKGGSTITFYANEKDATRNAKAAEKTTGGTVEQSGNILVVTQGGPESEAVQGCVS
jgi:hypothetical protein